MNTAEEVFRYLEIIPVADCNHFDRSCEGIFDIGAFSIETISNVSDIVLYRADQFNWLISKEIIEHNREIVYRTGLVIPSIPKFFTTAINPAVEAYSNGPEMDIVGFVLKRDLKMYRLSNKEGIKNVYDCMCLLKHLLGKSGFSLDDAEIQRCIKIWCSHKTNTTYPIDLVVRMLAKNNPDEVDGIFWKGSRHVEQNNATMKHTDEVCLLNPSDTIEWNKIDGYYEYVSMIQDSEPDQDYPGW